MVRFGSDLLVELRKAISQLGDEGGLISASVYETAQVLRLYPPTEGVVPGLEWLLSQQLPDGGWGIPTVPSTRDVPTLAAVLVLHEHRHECAAEQAVQAGLDFLQRQAHQWESMHIDLVPVAGEVIMPYLLEEAERMGLVIDWTPYEPVFELRQRKLRYLQGQPLQPNSAPTLSWEALGLPFMPGILHPHTGVGHSPAATAAWLRSARSNNVDPVLCAKGEAYLARASATTGTGIPGIMPMAYPITGFELCYGLYALLLTGLLKSPALQDVIAPKVEQLRAMVEDEQGLGFGEGFTPDVDDTAVAIAVLLAAKKCDNVAHVRRFWQNDHFFTFAHELNPSVFSNAHALHALVLGGERSEPTEEFLIRQQTQSGAWVIDKWHTSWRSSTLEVIAALLPLGYEKELVRAGQSLINDQNPDGSWGAPQGAPILETTYCVIALQLLACNPRLTDGVHVALKHGRQWLWDHINDLDRVEHLWICKEVFSPVRVDIIYKLGAFLSPVLSVVQQIAALPAEASLQTIRMVEQAR